MMDCNSESHVELNNIKQFVCPFCNGNFKNTQKSEPCCENMDLTNLNGQYVCQCCGQVDRYEIIKEFMPISS